MIPDLVGSEHFSGIDPYAKDQAEKELDEFSKALKP